MAEAEVAEEDCALVCEATGMLAAGVLVPFTVGALVAVCDFAGGARVIVRPSGLKVARSGVYVVTSISAAPLFSE